MDIWWEREFRKLVNNFWNYLADEVSLRSDSTDKRRNSARQNNSDVPEQIQRWQLSHWNLKYPRLNSPIQISVILNSTIQSLAFMRQTIVENRYELQKPVVTTSNHQDILVAWSFTLVRLQVNERFEYMCDCIIWPIKSWMATATWMIYIYNNNKPVECSVYFARVMCASVDDEQLFP